MSFGEEGENSQNLEHLVSGFNIRQYLAKAGAYAAGHARPYILTGLAFLMLATSIGCPLQKKKRDHDTIASSSGAPTVTTPTVVTLSQAGQDALETRFNQSAFYMTAEGTGNAEPTAEADKFLGTIANAGSSNADVNTFIEKLYQKEVESGYNILCGGTPVTSTQFSGFFKYFSATLVDKIAASQTTVPYAGEPMNGQNMTNFEIDNKMSGSGWGIAVDFTNKAIRFYLKDKDGNEVAYPTYSGFTDGDMATIKDILKRSVAGTYLDNELTQTISVSYAATGEPKYTINSVTTTSQETFDEP